MFTPDPRHTQGFLDTPLGTLAKTNIGSFLLGLLVFKPLENQFDKLKKRVTERWNMRIERELSRDISKVTFHFGNLRANVYVSDYQPTGYLRNAIRSSIIAPPSLEIPKQWRNLHDSYGDDWKKKLQAGTISNNSKRLALTSYTISTLSDEAEQRMLVLKFRWSDYVEQRTVASLFKDPLYQKEYRKRLTDDDQNVDPLLSQTFGASIAVISANGHLLFPRRSQKAAVNPGRYTCGVAEGMTSVDVPGPKSQPDVFKLAERAILEELGINLDAKDSNRLQMTALILDRSFYEWGILGYLDLRGTEYTSQILLQYHKTAKGKDKWECGNLEFVPFHPKDVALFLNDRDVTNYGAVCAVLALLSVSASDDKPWPRKTVADAFEKHYKRKEMIT